MKLVIQILILVSLNPCLSGQDYEGYRVIRDGSNNYKENIKLGWILICKTKANGR